MQHPACRAFQPCVDLINGPVVDGLNAVIYAMAPELVQAIRNTALDCPSTAQPVTRTAVQAFPSVRIHQQVGVDGNQRSTRCLAWLVDQIAPTLCSIGPDHHRHSRARQTDCQVCYRAPAPRSTSWQSGLPLLATCLARAIKASDTSIVVIWAPILLIWVDCKSSPQPDPASEVASGAML